MCDRVCTHTLLSHAHFLHMARAQSHRHIFMSMGVAKQFKAAHEHVWDQGRRSKLANEGSRNGGHTRFSFGKASPVLSCHPQSSLKCLVHGDDFVVSGEQVDLVWMRNELGSKLEINKPIPGDVPGIESSVGTM